MKKEEKEFIEDNFKAIKIALRDTHKLLEQYGKEISELNDEIKKIKGVKK